MSPRRESLVIAAALLAAGCAGAAGHVAPKAGLAPGVRGDGVHWDSPDSLEKRTFEPTTPRWAELSFKLVPLAIDLGDSGAVKGVYLPARVGSGLEVEAGVRPKYAQWLKTSTYVGLLYGRWSGATSGDTDFLHGFRVSIEPISTRSYSPYGFVSGGIGAVASSAVDPDHPFEAHAGGGLGFRFFRLLSVEATADEVWALGLPAGSIYGGVANLDRTRIGVGVRLDVCGLMGLECGYERPRQTITVDSTCTLVSLARSIGERAEHAGLKPRLCEAVDAALAGDGTNAPERTWSFETFLADLADQVRPERLRGDHRLADDVAQLERRHAAIKTCVEASRRDQQESARLDRALLKRYVYSPFPPALAASLGCVPLSKEPPTLMVCEESTPGEPEECTTGHP